MIIRVCLFVGWLVRYACCDFSKSIRSIFMQLTQMFSSSKVKVQNQNHHNVRQWFKICSRNLAIGLPKVILA